VTGPIPVPVAVATGGSKGVWGKQYRWVTIGAVMLIFLVAIQSLAVTTVMPIVSADLDGELLYAVAFAGTLATSVIGMVAVGAWCDRRGVLLPLTTAVVFFAVGLLVAGFATTMETLVVGRLVQGLGGGGQTVALYVVVARVFPTILHGRVFAAFSAAWVIPALIGPFLAGAVTELLNWRWVFFGVAILTFFAFSLVAWRLASLDLSTKEPSTTPIAPRMMLALAVAIGALALSLASSVGEGAWVVIVIGMIMIALAIRPLLPKGTLRAKIGLPSVVLMRALIAGALFGAEIYLPKLLIEEYEFSPVWAGLGLTSGALAWAIAAEVQGRIGDRLGNRRIVILGTSFAMTAYLAALATALWQLHPVVIIGFWALAGLGMGLIYPRLTVLTLGYSTPANQGFNSSALSISDSVGTATTIAIMGFVYVALSATGAGYVAVFGIATLLAFLSLVPGLRLGHGGEALEATLSR
jgi:MFS family permease